VQKYGKLPALVNCRENSPLLFSPESHNPPELVVECSLFPTHTHRTVSFTLMLETVGEKKLSPTLTRTVAACADATNKQDMTPALPMVRKGRNLEVFAHI
jgi:hypothetical protein